MDFLGNVLMFLAILWLAGWVLRWLFRLWLARKTAEFVRSQNPGESPKYNRKEGEVRVGGARAAKKVNKNVGQYVDFEETTTDPTADSTADSATNSHQR